MVNIEHNQLNLGVRAWNVLLNYDIVDRKGYFYKWSGGRKTHEVTREFLQTLTKWQLLRQPNCGKKTVEEIIEALAGIGIQVPEGSEFDHVER